MGKKTKDFEVALMSLLGDAEKAGQAELTVTAGSLHQTVGGYAPQTKGEHHAMAAASNVLKGAVTVTGGEVLNEPPKGRGATVEVTIPIAGWIQAGRRISPTGGLKHERNPTWASDELILALDLYFRHPPTTISKNHPEVIALSLLLNTLPIHTERPDRQRFRNANGVYMKMCNFLRFDPTYEGSGLTGGGSGEQVVWDDFSFDVARLKGTADAIRQTVLIGDISDALIEEDGYQAPEGTILSRLHHFRERSRSLVARKKRHVMEKNGSLLCEVCAFNFGVVYGPLGADFIECHHTKPVSTLVSGQTTSLADLAVVCANCHRMLHRRRPWHTVDSLRAVLQTFREALREKTYP